MHDDYQRDGSTHSLPTVHVLSRSMKPTLTHDASIAIEGIGLISSCLNASLQCVTHTKERMRGDPETNERPTVPLLDSCQADCIMRSFGEAVLATQRGCTGSHVHASLHGTAEYYNRIGQNWRIVADPRFNLELQDGALPNEKQRNSACEASAESLSSPAAGKAVVLACGDA